MSEHPPEALSGGAGGRGNFAQPAEPEPLKTTRLRVGYHRTAAFRSERSPRVQGFFERDMPRFVADNYCKVLVLPDANDPTGIWGYYTLSPYKLEPEELSNKQRRAFRGSLSIPMMKIGFLGRDDAAPPGLGQALLVDAARRIYRSDDTAGAALILDADGGPGTKLYAWYRDRMGFLPIREKGVDTGTLFCPLASLIPEEWQGN